MAEIASTGEVYLPKAVRDKIKIGEDAFAAAMTAAEQPEPEQPPVEQPPPPPVEEPPPQPEEPPPAEEPPPEHAPTDLSAELASVKHAYKTLQGRYASETKRARDQFAEMQRHMQELQQQVTQLTTAAVLRTRETEEKPPQKNQLTLPSTYDSVTEEEVKEFGPAFLDMVGRVAREVVTKALPGVDGLAPQVQNLSTQVENLGRNSKAQRDARLHSWLDGNVSGWREQDADPLFNSWLEQDDPYSGVRRMEILANAMATENYPRVKLIFEGYAQETQAVTPPPRTTTPAGQNGQARLSGSVAPGNGRGRGAPIVEPAEVPLTSAQIKAYYDRKLRYPKSLTEAEITQMEARIARQLATPGTIRGGQRF